MTKIKPRENLAYLWYCELLIFVLTDLYFSDTINWAIFLEMFREKFFCLDIFGRSEPPARNECN